MDSLGSVILGTEPALRASKNDELASELMYLLFWVLTNASSEGQKIYMFDFA